MRTISTIDLENIAKGYSSIKMCVSAYTKIIITTDEYAAVCEAWKVTL
jgi:flagellum-specific peptidoglycan hydrolase FlgJ